MHKTSSTSRQATPSSCQKPTSQPGFIAPRLPKIARNSVYNTSYVPSPSNGRPRGPALYQLFVPFSMVCCESEVLVIVLCPRRHGPHTRLYRSIDASSLLPGVDVNVLPPGESLPQRIPYRRVSRESDRLRHALGKVRRLPCRSWLKCELQNSVSIVLSTPGKTFHPPGSPVLLSFESWTGRLDDLGLPSPPPSLNSFSWVLRCRFDAGESLCCSRSNLGIPR